MEGHLENKHGSYILIIILINSNIYTYICNCYPVLYNRLVGLYMRVSKLIKLVVQ